MSGITLQEFMNDKDVVMGDYQRAHAKCADGLTVSIQASRWHYSEPRQTFSDKFESLELGFPTERDELIMPYAQSPEYPTETVYPYVPWDVVEKMVEKHGNIVAAVIRYK